MPWIAIQTVTFAVGMAGLLLAIMGLVGRRSRGGVRCRACDYDVADIIDEQATCPECGKPIRGKRGTVSGGRVRRTGLVVAGVLLLLPASAAGWYVSMMVQPVAARPTWLIAGVLWLGPTADNAELARELERRWHDGTLDGIGRSALVDWGLSAWTAPHESRGWNHAAAVRAAIMFDALSPAQFDRFVDQLLTDIDDDSNTSRQRVALGIASQLGTSISPRLERALDEPRFRDAAVMLLLDDLGNVPSEALVQAAIASLSHRAGGPDAGPALDRLPLSIQARRAARYLTHHASICAPALRLELTHGDPQRRLLAALALTAAGEPSDAEAIGRAVAHALEPNAVRGDATLATGALVRAGPVSAEAAERTIRSDAARRRLGEVTQAFAEGALPPHLERLAGPLPWQVPNRRPRGGTVLP